MRFFHSFWAYSLGLGVVWALVLTLATVSGGAGAAPALFLVFGGFCMAWVSATVARYVYPPPKRWRAAAITDPEERPPLRHRRTDRALR